MQSHTGEFQNCNYCDFKSDIKSHFDERKGFRRNLHRCEHGDAARAARVFHCTKCDFSSKLVLTKHMLSHTVRGLLLKNVFFSF